MRKLCSSLLILALCIALLATTSSAAGKPEEGTCSAIATNNAIVVSNGAGASDAHLVHPAVYKIEGANYFKLRDIAMLLNGSEKQFAVDYDDNAKAVSIISGKPYTEIGTELSDTAAASRSAIMSNNTISINDEPADLTVFKIDGANYFKLRDLGKALDFYVGYDDETKTVYISGSKGYEAEDNTPYTCNVAFANWTDDSRIYTGALNGKTMTISSVRHLPVYKFDTKEELDAFKASYSDILTMDRGLDETPSFEYITAAYDDSFFSKYSLILSYVEASSGSFRFGVRDVYCDAKSFCMYIEQLNSPEAYTADMAGWFVVVEVNKEDIAECTDFDAQLGPASGSVARGGNEKLDKFAIHTVTLSEQPAYPDEKSFIRENGEYDSKGLDEAYTKWNEVQRERRGLLADPSVASLDLSSFDRETAAIFLAGDDSVNHVYSPLNVYLALSMLAEITDGNTRAQILELLGTDNIETTREAANRLFLANYINDGAATSFPASSVWLRDGTEYRVETLDVLADKYFASSFKGEMGSDEYNKALREWLNEQTGGLLENEAGKIEMDPETVLSLATTLYYKVRWNSTFNAAANTEDVFHAPSGDVMKTFMHQSGAADYYWGDKFSAICRPFVEGGEMWLILPDEGVDPAELLTDSEASGFIFTNSKYNWENRKHLVINQSVPKFDATDSFDLNCGLRALGIADAMDIDKADFSPVVPETEKLFLSSARHAARVTIDEEGCLAAAFTVMMMCGSAMPPDEEVDFVLDRPFIFAIVSDTSQLLFTGIVNMP